MSNKTASLKRISLGYNQVSGRAATSGKGELRKTVPTGPGKPKNELDSVGVRVEIKHAFCKDIEVPLMDSA